jgi:RNA polymerase sigma factor (sigma-70 family)
MSDTTLLQLHRQLVAHYGEIKRRLIQRLGDHDLAEEVLQETYIHLTRPVEFGIVRSPTRYLLMVATNIARMRFRRERPWVNLEDVDAAVGLVDDAPDPARSAEARLELEALQSAFDELTPRRRHILIAARFDARNLKDIAAELGLSQRMVEIELKHALDHCALRLDRALARDFGSRPRNASQGGGE